MKKLLLLIAIVGFTACGSADQESANKAEPDKPFIHTAYFWFKDSVRQDESDAFYASTEKLREIGVVLALYTGKPANTTRATVERSYDYAVVIHLKDLAAHDVYQKDPIHLKILADFSDLWEKVMITDIE
jgi:gamma-glutamyltranspeptidase